jgi:hypothetical protein
MPLNIGDGAHARNSRTFTQKIKMARVKHKALGTYYGRNQARLLAGVKARQARLGEAYLQANREQMRRNRRKRRDRGQTFLAFG